MGITWIIYTDGQYVTGAVNDISLLDFNPNMDK